jgi:cellulose synthase/poly-beta-1,6-N-acetylglucosamine synthase-like glycosyltransferase
VNSFIAFVALAVLAGKAPEPPRARVEIAYPARAGRTIAVKAGGDFQEALETAKPGDEIVLEAGATFSGPFTLPAKDGATWIVVRSSAVDQLTAGKRVTPEDASSMPKLESRWGAVLSAEAGSHHYRFVGIEIRPARGAFLTNVVLFGSRETTLAEQPHHLIIDRCFIHGDPLKGSRRGIALGSRETAIVDSWISDFKEGAADSQAVAGWNGAGPFRIENNFLEAAGENLMFGGADPKVPGLVPSDIEIVGNHFSKPLPWKKNDPAYAGASWAVKNLFELKNARRVLVAKNLFERSWVDAQNGFAILFTVRNQDGKAPWSSVEDVTFENNVVRQAAAGINVLGRDDAAQSGPAGRIAIRNNLFEDIGTERWGGGGKLFQILAGAVDVAIEHNTAFQTGSIVTAEGAPNRGFVYRDNIAPHNAHGIVGTAVASGNPTRAAFFPDGVFRRNVIAGGDAQKYPPDNFFPGSLDDVGFVDRDKGDYRLGSSSKYRKAATDGTDVGADVERLQAAFAARSRDLSTGTRTSSLAASMPSAIGEGAAAAILTVSVLLLAYANVGYPAFLLLWGRARPKLFRTDAKERSVSIVISAHNESAGIAARIENLMSLDYPRSCIEILVGLDGCTDDTAERAKALGNDAVQVIEFAERRGKPSVLNALVGLARGEIVIFADARQRFDPAALRSLVAPFADPSVGAVSGELVLTGGDGRPIERGLGLYWRIEKGIRRMESETGSVVGATGAIYAIRRRLYEPLPQDAILDDVLVPMRVARRGGRVVFEPRARAYDQAPSSPSREFTRKVRTIAGNFQLFARERWLLGFGNPLLLRTLSHKGLRLLTPLLLAAAFIANLFLLNRPLFQILLIAQVAFYVTAFLGRSLERARVPGLGAPYVVCLLAWATTVAFFSYLAGRQKVTWAKGAAA